MVKGGAGSKVLPRVTGGSTTIVKSIGEEESREIV